MKNNLVISQSLNRLMEFLIKLLTIRAGLYIKQTPSDLKEPSQ